MIRGSASTALGHGGRVPNDPSPSVSA
jgi:hypothetical protein